MERTEQSGGTETWEVLEDRAGAASGGSKQLDSLLI